MDDDKKRPAGFGGKGRGPKKPYAGRDGGDRPAGARDGDKKPFQRQDGAKRAYGGKDGGAARPARPGKFERREGAAAGGDKPRFEKRDGDRPFRKPDGEKRPYTPRDGDAPRKPRPYAERSGDAPRGDKPRFEKRDGDRPFRKPDGEKRPYTPRDGDAPRGPRPYADRGGDRPRGDKPRFEKRDGDRPFRERDGEKRPYTPRDGDAPRGPRPYADRGGDRPRGDKPRFEKRDGDRPFRERDGEKRPYTPRDGDAPRGPRPYADRGGDRPRGDKPRFEKRDGDRPFRERDGEKRPYTPRDGDAPRGPRPYADRGGDRPRGDKPRFEKRDGDRPFRDRDDRAPRFEKRDDAAATLETDGSERIAKRLARAGVASRRDAEALIADGRIRLNGKVLTSPAVNVTASDKIELDGKEIPPVERTRLFLFHKPAGVVTTSRDPEGRSTVFDVLPAGLPRLMTVGRLDINTEGLLLLTNDGGLSRVLELPATGWLRRYRVRVHGKVDLKALESLKDGIAVDGVFYGAIEATLDREQGTNAWLTVGFREGKNREVKNVLGAIGLDVNRLIRVSYGPFQLGELGEGEVRELKGKMLREQLGERLIEESGANFDAPILNEFSNKPVSVKAQVREEEEREAPINRKREREQRREDALGRLDTRRPPRGGAGGGGAGGPGGKKPFGGKGGRDDRDAVEPRSRTTNVWMAPGARPVGEKKAAALSERRFAGKPRPQGGKPSGDRPFKPGAGPRKPRGDK